MANIFEKKRMILPQPQPKSKIFRSLFKGTPKLWAYVLQVYKTNMLHKEHVHRKHLQTVVEFLQGNIGTGIPFIFVCEQLCINR